MMSCQHTISGKARFAIDERNRRIKLFCCGHDIEAAVDEMVSVAGTRGLEKLWGFVTPQEWEELQHLGFVREGILDGYFGETPGIGVARYLSAARAQSRHRAQEDAIVVQAMMHVAPADEGVAPGYTVRAGRREDSARISEVLTAVFASYPTPIDSAQAIEEAMDRGVYFSVAEYNGAFVSVASADVDAEHAVAEMTDCATLPVHRGRGLMRSLLAVMEDDMRAKGLRTLFTLARATSVGMNMVFARLGYRFRGRFVNNCHIAGDWEDMNLWTKRLA